MIDNREKVSRFLKLQSKREDELRAICEGIGISTSGTRQELLNALIEMSPGTAQTNPTQPQAISLRSRDNTGETMERAVTAFKKWRKLIFDGKTNTKEFLLLNASGKQYSQTMKYLLCDANTATQILKAGWYHPHDSQKDLINLITCQPENFVFTIVRKHNKNGQTFLMLHCQPKDARKE